MNVAWASDLGAWVGVEVLRLSLSDRLKSFRCVFVVFHHAASDSLNGNGRTVQTGPRNRTGCRDYALFRSAAAI
jgi:hypothetical protein